MQPILVSYDQSGQTNFWPQPTHIFFNQHFVFINLYQHAKKYAFSSCSGDIVNLKTLQSDWVRAFWPICQEPDFPKYGISSRIKQIISTSFKDQIQKKLMTKFSNKSPKPYFWPHFSNFWDKTFFGKNPALSCKTHRPLTSCWVSEKPNSFTNSRVKMGKAVASSYSPHQKFLDTGIISKTFQQSWKQYSFREILTGSAKFYRS